MAGNSKRKKGILGKLLYTLVLLAYAGLLAFVSVTWLSRLQDYAEQYELSRPAHTVDAYLEAVNRDQWSDGIAQAIEAMPHEAQTDEEIRAFVQERLRSGITAVRKSGVADSGTQTYSMRCNGREIGTMTIVEDTAYRGKVNLEEMPWPLVSRFLPGILEWGLKPWIVSSESYDFSNLYSSVEVTVPSTYSVYLNDTLLGSEYIVEEGIHYDVYEKYYNDLPMLPTKVTYRFDNVIGDVQVRILDEEGNPVEIDPDMSDYQFVTPADEETLLRLYNMLQAFTEKYLIFRSGATDSVTALNDLRPYIVPGSDIEKRAQAALDGLSWAHTSSVRVSDFSLNGVLPLVPNFYVCEVSATADTYTYGKGEVTDYISLTVLVYDDGATTLAFMVS